MIKIKEHLDSIDNLDFSTQPKTVDVVGVIKVALAILAILLKGYIPFIRSEVKKTKYKGWLTAIETGSLITTIFKP